MFARTSLSLFCDAPWRFATGAVWVSILAVACLTLRAQQNNTTGGAEAVTPELEQLDQLEAFIVEETTVGDSGEILPLGRPVEDVFLGEMTVLEIPRAVTVLTPEAMEQFAIEGFEDLPRAGASMQRPNFFGVAGAPFIRGAQAGVYFNGIKRIHNRNEVPMSFGSLEAMNIVKGPAPVHFGPSNSGGYVNFIPKSPYYDKFRGSVSASVGSWDYYHAQADAGGPTTLFGNPAAWRVSVSGQANSTYYNNLQDDYYSTYLALKSEVAEDVKIFTGFEFYDHRANENAGWNRVTQNLIDNGRYVVGGADPRLTAANYVLTNGSLAGTVVPLNGTADITTINAFFGDQLAAANGANNTDLALAIPVSRWNALGGPVGGGGATAFTHNGVDYYKYNPTYFANGNEALTAPISRQNVLADPDDYNDSKTFLGFFDYVNERNPDQTLTSKFLVEYMQNEKLSSYGYAAEVENFALTNRLEIDREAWIFDRKLDYKVGIEGRYNYSWFVEDFSLEPFNRRDLSTGTIPPESIVYAGPQLLWSQGHASKGRLLQAGLFGLADYQATEKLSVLVGARAEQVFWDYGDPDEWNGTPQGSDVGDTNFINWSVSPVYEVLPGIHLYAAVQGGTTEAPSDHGTYSDGESNFHETELYEAGIKAALFEDKVFAQAAAFYWDRRNFVTTPGGPETRAYRSEGLELEVTALPAKGWTLIGSVTAQKIYNRLSLPFRTRPLTEEEIALYGGAIQYGAPNNLPANPDHERPGFAQVSANLFAIYEFGNGFGLGAGPSWSDGFWGNYEHSLRYPSATIWNANAFYRGDRFEVFLRLNNVTDEEWFRGNDGSFAANTITTPGEPFNARLTVTYKF